MEEKTQAPTALPVTWRSPDSPIAWKPWSADSFREASKRDCPVLLYLAAPGCDGLFAGTSSGLAFMVEERFVGMRVDPFRRPDIARRYPTGGWPALVVTTPTGHPFATAVDIPSRNVEMFLLRLADDYEQEREAIEKSIRRADKRAGQAAPFAVDADQVYQASAAAFDPVYGGFGRGSKFPETSTLSFLLEYHSARREEFAWRMVERTLEALLNSLLVDSEQGGVCAYSHTADWQTPAREKEALDQAGLLTVLLMASRDGRADFATAVESLMDYIAAQLFDGERGAFRGRQIGIGAEEWWTDPLVYADRHAALISACAAVAEQLGDARAERMALAAADFLLENCVDQNGAVRHTCDETGVWGLLEDQTLVSQALLDAHGLSGEPRLRKRAEQTISFMEDRLFDDRAHCFVDRPEGTALEGLEMRFVGDYRDAFLPAGNVLAAELYMRLDDFSRAAALLGGKRLQSAPGRAHSSYARAILRISGRSRVKD